jgi:porin
LLASVVPHSVISGQEPKPSPPAAPKPEPNFLTQPELTGDWGGTRSGWKEKGVELEFLYTQFVQGITSGGLDERGAGTGKFQTAFKFDLGKLAGWNFWSAEVKTETRFGGPLLTGTGALNPVNTSALIPTASGNTFTISAVNITKLFPIDLKKGELIAVSLGRFNFFDLIDEDFFGGRGIDRFLNMAQIGPLTVLREVPIITNAVNFAYIRGGEPFITFTLLDPNDHSLDPGLSDLFSDGVSLVPSIHFPVKYFGKSAKHSFGGAVTTKLYTPFDAIRQIIIPGPPVFPVEPQRGSWSASYTFRQYIVERSRKDGWGLFSQIAFANKSTSPISRFVNVGIGGNGLFSRRPEDEFGFAYAHTDLSDVLKDNIDPLNVRRLRAEHQVEMFYNFRITPWLRLTADLQILRPTRLIADTAIVPGARLEVIF